MNRRRWLVSGPPRTGGHLLLGILQSAGVLSLHTHNPRYRTKNDRLATLIRLRRRDIFSALMSNCLVWHTGQSTCYSNAEVMPFTVSKNDFLMHYAGHVFYHTTNIQQQRFATVTNLYFEDFVNNNNFALTELGITSAATTTQFTSRKCPYNYLNTIENHHELRDYFNSLQQQDITTLKITNPYDRLAKRSKKKQIFT